jgi:hypothetical protein
MPVNQMPQNNDLKEKKLTSKGSANPLGSVWQLSQSHLSQLTRCPRKFQYRYLEQWGLPTMDAQQERQTLGSQFHHLLQQQALGLDIQLFLKESALLQQWFDALQQFPPPLIGGERKSEHQRTLVYEGFTLVAVYDLLIENRQQAQILDWKTYPRPRNVQVLRHDWQTRLYLYLLVETSSYIPEQVSMVYWFAQVRSEASHSLVLPYDSGQHQQTHQALTQVLGQLKQSLAAYERGQSFSQAPIEDGQCYGRDQTCPFLARCRVRADTYTSVEEIALDLDAIAEIPL